MKEAVGSVLAVRAPVPAGLQRFISWSIAIHVVLASSVLAWQAWMSRRTEDTTMIITLSGTFGQTTGLTPVGGKQVDEVAPEPKRPTPTPVPTTTPNEMALPAKPATKTPPPKRESTSQVSSVVKPTTGSQVASGSSIIETGARGESSGLAQGGGAGSNSVQVDPDFEFCCKAYLNSIREEIQRHVNFNIGGHGAVVVKFEIARDGTIARTSVELVRSSNLSQLDTEAQYAVRQSKMLPLPNEYTPNVLKVTLTVQF